MKSIFFAAFSLMLLMGMSCSFVRHDTRRISSGPIGRSSTYKQVDHTMHTIQAIVKDNGDNQPLTFATVELYLKNYLAEPLMTAFTSLRGKFSFDLKNGDYIIIIRHNRCKEKQVMVSVEGWDIDLNEIKLYPVSD